jgi:PAS domain S-box-containing protein
VLVRLDGTIGSWSADARRMFGRSPAQMLGLPFFCLFTAESHDALDELAQAAQSEPRRALATAIDTDGTCFDAEVTSTRTLAVRDGSTGTVVLVRDVTEQRAVAACLRACSAGVDVGSVLAAFAEALTHWVPGAELTLDVLDEERGRSRRYRARGHGAVRPDRTATARVRGSHVSLPLAVEGRAFGTLNVAFRDTGKATPRTVRLLAIIADAVGSALSWAVEFEEKSRALGAYKRIDRLEREMRALITHDMRTPLALIAGFAGSLRDHWDDLQDRERLEGLDAILRNGQNLTRLVEQDLQLALIDAGELHCEIAPFDLGGQIECVVDEFARTALARFDVRVAESLPPARGDAHRNRQILENLLSNAVKFSPPGALIQVEVAERGPMAHVTVRDHGCGIAPSDRRKLFRKFVRLGEPGRVNGTGLGLYLAKCLVESQGGRIWVESPRGTGVAFTYTLPLAERRLPMADAG